MAEEGDEGGLGDGLFGRGIKEDPKQGNGQ